MASGPVGAWTGFLLAQFLPGRALRLFSRAIYPRPILLQPCAPRAPPVVFLQPVCRWPWGAWSCGQFLNILTWTVGLVAINIMS